MLRRMMRTTPALIAIVLAAAAIVPAARGDVWSTFVEKAAAEHGDIGRCAAEFLAANHPPRDADISLELLEENLRLALKAREAFPWARELSEEQFFNDVLPYASVDETRESWRPDFYEKCRPIVAECKTATEAAQALNKRFFNTINVHYNRERKAPNQSPAESIAQGRATCTGLAIILVDACRAVGVPARVAGIPNWVDKRGNHTWVEIWDGDWHFTGADEYNDQGLDRAWFVGDARKAIPGDREHSIWATSWAKTGEHFPMSWSPDDTSVPGVEVTPRYLEKSDAKPQTAATANSTVYLRAWTKRKGERFEALVEALDGDGKVVAIATTRAGTTDLNDMPALVLPRGKAATLRVNLRGMTRVVGVRPEDVRDKQTIDLYWDELGLAKQDAELILQALASARKADLARERQVELQAGAFKIGDRTLRVLEETFGEAPADGHSLWISLHGGGGAPEEVNDQQWKNQAKLYEPAEGIYVAPRAPTNTWNLWHQAHIDPLFDRLIETYVAARGVNPNRVYLLGYSAGGDGVFQVAPRMADRFAAAAMMAGHPNETQPLGLRNLPFAIFMGGDDTAYDRNKVAAEWRDKLDKLHAADPDGYPHRVTIYEGLQHWMEHRDAEALPWMAQQTRVAWPKKVVWWQDDVTHTRFYWLAVAPDAAKARMTIRAAVDGQTITIDSDDVSAVTLRLRDALVDLDQPITVIANGKPVFAGVVPRTIAAIEASLAERNDPDTAASAMLDVKW